MKAGLPLLALAATLAACAPAAKTPPKPVASAPAPRPAATGALSQRPAPLPAPADTHWMDAPLTVGGWRYERMERSTSADFLSPDNRRLASMICLSGGQVRLDVHAARSGSLTIRTETATRTQMAEFVGGHMIILLPPTDPLLDAMALSKGRFAVEVEGEPPLYLPSYAEVSRVIEDCR